MNQKQGALLLFALKLVISVVLLGVVFWRLDMRTRRVESPIAGN